MKLTAVPVNQKGKKFYVTQIPATKLIDQRIFRVAAWDPKEKNPKKQGYQRVEVSTRARKIGKYMTESDQPHESVLPGAILINSRRPIKVLSEGSGNVEIEIPEYPAFIVDGQHRVAGARHAIEELNDEELESYQFPVVLTDFDQPKETLHFKTVNEEAKKVSTELSHRLLRDLNLGGTDISTEKDRWTMRALGAIDALNADSESVWYKRIAIPGEKKTPAHISKQQSFESSLKPLYGKNARFSDEHTKLDEATGIMNNFWGALSEIFPGAFLEPKDYLIQRTPGLFSLHALLARILQYQPNPSRQDLKKILKAMAEGMDMTEDFWRAGKDADGAAVYGSMKGFNMLYEQMWSNIPSELLR
ncbi:MAG TPA: DGQHR domain-containing protein [Patescibacteria group bacterium]|jgi:DGQHR domain-containing protein